MARRRSGQSRSAARRDSGLFKKIEEWLRVKTRQHRYKHVFKGDVKYYPPDNRPGASGFHHRYRGRNPQGARVRLNPDGTEMITGRGKYGVYRARVDIQAPDGQWIPKSKQSTFFPDDMTPQEVDESISQAFRNREIQPENSTAWDGHADNGMYIGGFTDVPGGNRWKTVYPIMESE